MEATLFRLLPFLFLAIAPLALAAKPSLNVDITGNAATATLGATATALASNPSDCSSNNYATAIDASGNLTCATITAGALPNPSSSTLGGVQSAAAQSNKWINSISTSGVPALSQPAFTDVSGSVAAAQMPALTGDITTSSGAVATTIGATKVTNAMLAGSIAASKLVGSDIATVGTVTTGVWSGTPLVLTKVNPFIAGYAIPTIMYPGASNVTDTTGALVSVTGMSFAIGASEVWAFTFWIQSQCNNSGGVDYGINGPVSATIRAMAQGASTGITGRTSAVISALNTATGVSFNTVNSAGGWVEISGIMTNSTNAGTFQLQFDAHTASQTATIFKESWGIAVRVL